MPSWFIFVFYFCGSGNGGQGPSHAKHSTSELSLSVISLKTSGVVLKIDYQVDRV